jgi:hypothetical protein
MTDNLKIKLRALSLGILPSDAKEQSTESSLPEMNSEIVERKPPSIDDPHEPHHLPETLDDEGKSGSRPRSVTFQDNLPGSPMCTPARSAPPHASSDGTEFAAQDQRIPSTPPPPPQSPSPGHAPIRRSKTENAPSMSLSSSLTAAASLSSAASFSNLSSGEERPLRRSKTFKIHFEAPTRSNPANSLDASFRADYAAMTSSNDPEKKTGRRFSVLYGALDVPEEYTSPNTGQSGDSDPNITGKRREAVFLKQQFSSMSLKEIDKHVKDMARMDFAFAMLALGGLGIAVSLKS